MVTGVVLQILNTWVSSLSTNTTLVITFLLLHTRGFQGFVDLLEE
jgi:hypothetical protein